MDAFNPYSMLYQTHHPLIFHFPSFLPPSISHLPLPLPPSSPFSLLQAETQMECVEAALKTSFTRDSSLKLNPLDDSSSFNLPNAAIPDDFSVDELLDFSHLEEPFEDDEHHHQKPDSASLSPPPLDPSHQISHFDLPSSELNVPADDLANLEWLSHFVEDSFAVHPTAYPTAKPKSQTEQKPQPNKHLPTHPCFKTPLPAKARSKRTRAGIRVWPSITESSSSSTSSSSSSSSPTSPLFVSPEQAWPPAKRPKKKPSPEASGGSRRCSHCGVHRTPQWRTGPMGAKTLCNACGVRFKSGRLLPEYRPACSPTFSSELHSNHHRKVLEMRRKKEGVDGGEAILGGATTTPAVQSF